MLRKPVAEREYIFWNTWLRTCKLCKEDPDTVLFSLTKRGLFWRMRDDRLEYAMTSQQGCRLYGIVCDIDGIWLLDKFGRRRLSEKMNKYRIKLVRAFIMHQKEINPKSDLTNIINSLRGLGLSDRQMKQMEKL